MAIWVLAGIIGGLVSYPSFAAMQAGGLDRKSTRLNSSHT